MAEPIKITIDRTMAETENDPEFHKQFNNLNTIP